MKKLNIFRILQNSPLRTVLLLCIASTAGLTYNGMRKNPLPLIHREIKLNPGSILGTQEVYLLYRQGDVLFIDTRYEDEYQTEHIPSAINLPARLPVDEIMNQLQSFGKDEKIVIYCGSVQCNSARRLAGFMKQLGFTTVYIFSTGFEAWIENDLPVARTTFK